MCDRRICARVPWPVPARPPGSASHGRAGTAAPPLLSLRCGRQQELRAGSGPGRRRPRRPGRRRSPRWPATTGPGSPSLIKCIAGIHAADAGEMLMAGRAGAHPQPGDAAALGIETVYQDLALCDNLDIVENMFLGRERLRRGRSTRSRWSRPRRRRSPSLAVTTVRSVRQPVASLSGGQRQSVAIAKAVLWNSKLVIMDEPTAALGVAQTRMVLDLVRRLADRGIAVLIDLAQHERRLRGRGPDRRAAARADGRGAPDRPRWTSRSSST